MIDFFKKKNVPEVLNSRPCIIFYKYYNG